MMASASIQIVENVRKHPDADRLELVNILGYQCVVQKGLYKGWEKVVYITTDSLLPVELWTEDYRKYSPKRIKALKLRGEWSEGIIVPTHILPGQVNGVVEYSTGYKKVKIKKLSRVKVGTDVSEMLNVIHYEPPAPQDLKIKASVLPFGIPKTDEERWESMKNKIPFGKVVDVSLKVDGQSCSYYYDVETETFGVLGRTQELYEIFENNYTKNIELYDIKNKLISYCKKNNVSLCIRGESYGSGIQWLANNVHSKMNKWWAMFSIFDIKKHEYQQKESKHYFLNVAKKMDIPTVEIIEKDVVLTQELINKYSFEISELNGKPFEGVVIKHDTWTFKVINKTYDSNK